VFYQLMSQNHWMRLIPWEWVVIVFYQPA